FAVRLGRLLAISLLSVRRTLAGLSRFSVATLLCVAARLSIRTLGLALFALLVALAGLAFLARLAFLVLFRRLSVLSGFCLLLPVWLAWFWLALLRLFIWLLFAFLTPLWPIRLIGGRGFLLPILGGAILLCGFLFRAVLIGPLLRELAVLVKRALLLALLAD